MINRIISEKIKIQNYDLISLEMWTWQDLIKIESWANTSLPKSLFLKELLYNTYVLIFVMKTETKYPVAESTWNTQQTQIFLKLFSF